MQRVSLRAGLVPLLIAVILFVAVSRGRAQSIEPVGSAIQGIGITALVVVGVGVYFVARAPRTTGCVVREGGGLALDGLQNSDPGYLLEGNTDSLHEGERVKVIGRRRAGAGHRKVLRVSGVARNYGPCSAVASASKPTAP